MAKTGEGPPQQDEGPGPSQQPEEAGPSKQSARRELLRRPGVWILGLLPIHALGLWLLGFAPGVVETLYAGLIFPIVAVVHRGIDATPLSPALVILSAIVGGCALTSWRSTRQPWPATRRFVWRFGVAVAVVGHLFSVSWGLNYLRPPLPQRLGLDLTIEPEAFAASAARVVSETNALRLEWGEPGLATLDAQADAALRTVLADLDLDAASHPRRSRLWPERMFMATGFSGVTLPWTTETWIDPGIDPRKFPMVCAHEKAHQAGVAPEAEANFVAWLALSQAPQPRLRYAAWFYVVHLFEDAAPNSISREVAADQAAARAVWKKAENKVLSESTHKAYDTYLRVNQVKAGIRDYSRVAVLIHAWLKKHPEWAKRN